MQFSLKFSLMVKFTIATNIRGGNSWSARQTWIHIGNVPHLYQCATLVPMYQCTTLVPWVERTIGGSSTYMTVEKIEAVAGYYWNPTTLPLPHTAHCTLTHCHGYYWNPTPNYHTATLPHTATLHTTHCHTLHNSTQPHYHTISTLHTITLHTAMYVTEILPTHCTLQLHTSAEHNELQHWSNRKHWQATIKFV